MNNFFKKILNLGIETTTDYWVSRRIQQGNSVAVVIAFFVFLQTMFSFFAGLPFLVILFQGIFILFCLVTFCLNYFSKTVAARIFLFIVCNLAVIGTSVLTGADLHYQYYAVSILGIPFLFFKDEVGKLKSLFALLPIFVFMFLEFYHLSFEPIVAIKASYVYRLSLINDVVFIAVSFIIFYLIYKENDTFAKALRMQSEVLEEKNTQLERFAYIAAHDLNEPLRTVTSFIDIVEEEYEDEHDENLKTYFSYIRNAITRMRTMIDGLLTYSRIGRSSKKEITDISSLILEIKADLSGVIKEKGAAIHFEKLPIINCIKIEMRQLFQNLITNAIKFQKPDVEPSIQISCLENIDHWEFCVSDNGIGIAPDNLKNIFQFFTKLHLRSEYKGQGIGLAFCKKIVEIHNGKIWVTSSNMEGSQFYFTIQKTIQDEKKIK